MVFPLHDCRISGGRSRPDQRGSGSFGIDERTEPELIFRGTPPIFRVQALPHPSVERGWLPVQGLRCQSVFYGIVMDVVEMILEIVFVANQVVSKTRLPYASILPLLLPWAQNGFNSAVGQKPLGELLFCPPPSTGIIRIRLGQCPQSMEVVGQQDDRFGPKRPKGSTFPQAIPQQFPPHFLGEYRKPLRCHHREKVGTPRKRAGDGIPP